MQNEFQSIGVLAIVQVQARPLNTGGPKNPRYDPAHIVVVPEIRLSNRGVIGIAADGTRIVDAHHTDHPESRFGGSNGISIGFTGHYDRMRTRFSEDLFDGVAGENLIVSGPLAPGPDDLRGRLVFENPDGSRFEFRLFKHMAPCSEFSQYVNGSSGSLPAEVLKETLQFLEGGTRGFALELVGAEEAWLTAGARLLRG
ncbi:MAG TPA: hypothetical protein VMN57_07720 [Anaerolineales bacterium]|nr:hypothetical protein [Anaerolineales bacterium]